MHRIKAGRAGSVPARKRAARVLAAGEELPRGPAVFVSAPNADINSPMSGGFRVRR